MTNILADFFGAEYLVFELETRQWATIQLAMMRRDAEQRTKKRVRAWVRIRKRIKNRGGPAKLSSSSQSLLNAAEAIVDLLLEFRKFGEFAFPANQSPSLFNRPADRARFVPTKKQAVQVIGGARRVIPFTTPTRFDFKLADSMDQLGMTLDERENHIVDQPQLFPNCTRLSSVAIFLEYIFSGKDHYNYRAYEHYRRDALLDLKRIVTDLILGHPLKRLISPNKDIGEKHERFYSGMIWLAKDLLRQTECIEADLKEQNLERAAGELTQQDFGMLVHLSQTDVSRILENPAGDLKRLISAGSSIGIVLGKFVELHKVLDRMLYESTNLEIVAEWQHVETDDCEIESSFQVKTGDVGHLLKSGDLHLVSRRGPRKSLGKKKRKDRQAECHPKDPRE